jgi:hypothetical protein
VEGYRLDSSDTGKAPVMGSYERGNKLLGYLKGRKILDNLTIGFSRTPL